jgi:hypothetical protein
VLDVVIRRLLRVAEGRGREPGRAHHGLVHGERAVQLVAGSVSLQVPGAGRAVLLREVRLAAEVAVAVVGALLDPSRRIAHRHRAVGESQLEAFLLGWSALPSQRRRSNISLDTSCKSANFRFGYMS